MSVLLLLLLLFHKIRNEKKKQKKPLFEMKWRVFAGASLNFTNRTTTFNIQGSVVIRTRLCIDLRVLLK